MDATVSPFFIFKDVCFFLFCPCTSILREGCIKSKQNKRVSFQQPEEGKAQYLCTKQKSTKGMKRKRVIFSSSGGTPAMMFVTRLLAHFGNGNIESAAARIAAACRRTPFLIEASVNGTILQLEGSTALGATVNGTAALIWGENIETYDKTIIIK